MFKKEKTLNLLESLKGGLKKALDDNIRPDEEVVISLGGQAGEALVATNKRVYILKAGCASGAMFGQKCKVFPYSQITSVEYSCGLTAGRVQITAAGSVEQTSGRRGSFLNDLVETRQAENVVNFPSQKKTAFQAAVNWIREALEEVCVKREGKATEPQTDIADQLRKLADLVQDGILSQEEFDVKKKQLLGI